MLNFKKICNYVSNFEKVVTVVTMKDGMAWKLVTKTPIRPIFLIQIQNGS